MNSKDEFINSFRQPKLHGNVIMDLNPFTKLGVAVGAVIAAGALGHYWIRVAVIAFCFLVVFLAGKTAAKRFLFLYLRVAPILLFFLIVLNTAFRPGDTVYWEWWIIGITKEGFLYGLAIALLITGICGVIMTFYIVTPTKDLMFALEKLGVSRSASYICLASLQSITDLGKSAKTIMESQSARGVETAGSLAVRFKALIPVLFPLLLGSIAATEEKTVAMETRAFASSVTSTHIYELRKTPAAEKIICILFDLAVIALVVWRFLG